MASLQILAKNPTKHTSSEQILYVFSRNIGMEFYIRWCAMIGVNRRILYDYRLKNEIKRKTGKISKYRQRIQ